MSTPPTKTSILLVDDETGVLARLSYELKDKFTVESCITGDEAVHKARKAVGGFRYAVIDYKLEAGSLDGLATTRELAALSNETFILLYSNVLAETSVQATERRNRAYEAGAHRFLQRKSGTEALQVQEFIKEMTQLESMRNRVADYYENRRNIPSLLGLLHLGIAIIDVHQRIWFMNDEMRRITGIEAGEQPRRPWFNWHEYEGNALYAADQNAPERPASTGRIFLSPLPARGPGLYYLRRWKQPVTGENGEVILSDNGPLAIIETVEDMTETEQLLQMTVAERLGHIANAIRGCRRAFPGRIEPFKNVAIYAIDTEKTSDGLFLTGVAPPTRTTGVVFDKRSVPRYEAILADTKLSHIGEFVEETLTDPLTGTRLERWIFWPLFRLGGDLVAFLRIGGDELLSEDVSALEQYVFEITRVLEYPQAGRLEINTDADQLRQELVRIDRQIELEAGAGSPLAILKLLIVEACRVTSSYLGHFREQRNDKAVLLKVGPHDYDAYENIAESNLDLTNLNSWSARVILSGVEHVIQDIVLKQNDINRDWQMLSKSAQELISQAKGICFLPLTFEGKCLGAMGLHTHHQDAYKPAKLRFLNQLAQRAARALFDLQVQRNLENQYRHLDVFNAITSLLITQPFDQRAIVEQTAKILVERGGNYRVVICLINARRSHIQAVASFCADPERDFSTQPNFRSDFPLDKPDVDIQPWVARTGQACTIDDASIPQTGIPKTQTENCRKLGIKAITVMPLHSGKEVIGTLHIERADKERLDVQELEHLQTIANSIGSVLGQVERMALLQMALHNISDRIRILNPKNEVLFQNCEHGDVPEGWLGESVSCEATCLFFESDHHCHVCRSNDSVPIGNSRHYIQTNEGKRKKAYEWERTVIRDFRQDLQPPFDRADSCIAYVERSLDLSDVYDLSIRLQGWLLRPGIVSTARQILEYLKELGFVWARIYLVNKDDRGPILRSVAEYGLQDKRNIDRFWQGKITFAFDAPDQQPWFVLNQQIDLAIFKIDGSVPLQKVKEIESNQGLKCFAISSYQYQAELEKSDQEWLEISLIVGSQHVGKISLSLKESLNQRGEMLRPSDFELLKWQALGMAVALFQSQSETQRWEYWRRVSYEIAHQIKNPLASQAQYIISLREELAKRPGLMADALPHLEGIDRTAVRIGDTMTRILELAKQSPLNLQKWDLPVLIQDAWDILSSKNRNASQTELEINGERKCSALADRQSLLMVLDALLTNAVNYGNTQQSDQKIFCGCYGPYLAGTGPAPQFPEEYCCIAVSDNGPGLPLAVVGNLAEPFKAHSDGSGLGLAICWNYSQRMQGQLIYTRNSSFGGSGATFIIVLRVANGHGIKKGEPHYDKR